MSKLGSEIRELCLELVEAKKQACEAQRELDVAEERVSDLICEIIEKAVKSKKEETK